MREGCRYGGRPMHIAAVVLCAFVALEHALFLVLESFLWTTPFGRRTFAMSREQAEATKVLAQNQGLYNGFLAAGLVWALTTGGDEGRRLALFFLACVVVAGLVGAITTRSGRLFAVQGGPALFALGALFL